TDSITGDAADEISDAAYSASSLDDKIYAMPVAVLPGGLFYSQDLFDQAGITENPTTLDELETATEQLKAAGIDPVALGAKDAWPAAHWYYWL
ncbi:extracellular solute-binding protein, partial [Lysobacter sp. 2RAB21]